MPRKIQKRIKATRTQNKKDLEFVFDYKTEYGGQNVSFIYFIKVFVITKCSTKWISNYSKLKGIR